MTSSDLITALDIRYGDDGLVPAVIQDDQTGAVLMIAFMNPEAVELSLTTRRTHFWSRSRKQLWRKGETSGHEQIVEEIFVNCERNSLLFKVRQIEACCHDGFPTCFYRKVESDGTLVVVEDRWFNPESVYGTGAGTVSPARLWFGAYEFLMRHPLESSSSTSRILRGEVPAPITRVADELIELAGVLDGTHAHGDQRADAVLEGSQTLYWLCVVALKRGLGWDDLRFDRALLTGDDAFDPPTSARLLRAESARWHAVKEVDVRAEMIHAAAALVAQAMRSLGIDPGEVIDHDLADLHNRPYLADYFAAKAIQIERSAIENRD